MTSLRERKEEEASLDLGSRADQGPWSSAGGNILKKKKRKEEDEEEGRGRHEEEGEPLGAQASRLHLRRLPGALLLRGFF